MNELYDAIIIGAGQAGPSLASRLAKAGMKVAIIERALFGGTCLNAGCIPTKTLVEIAKTAFDARNAGKFGIDIQGPVHVDMNRVMARVDAIRDQYQKNIEPWLRGHPNITVYRGAARFEETHIIRVNESRLEAKYIFINVGGRAFVPSMPGLDKISYLTNSSILKLKTIPEHLIIIGGSYIGLEFAQIFRRLGSQVTVIEKADRLIAREDGDVSDAIKSILEAEDINICLQEECVAFRAKGDRIVTELDCMKSKREIDGTHVLMAIGRKPNTDDLALEKAGIHADAQGYITVDESLQTNIPGIYALGDVNRKGAFTHTSYNDYEIVADNLLSSGKRRVSDRIQTYALFTDPPLGRAGLTEAQVRQLKRKALVARLPMSRIKRAVIKDAVSGFMKVIIDADSKVLLGAAILGAEGDEIIHSLLDVMYSGMPATQLERAMHIHPTISELIPTLLQGEWSPLT